jgi:diguanylate cyclase (GGDEF)-like protein/putative nucleotidyltransferase with HDIG domain
VTTSRAFERARRRPVVFLLVYGAFVVLIGITAAAQAILTTSHISQSLRSSVATADRAVVGTFIEAYLRSEDLQPGAVDDERYALLEARLRDSLAQSDFMDSEVRAVEVIDPTGRVLFSSTDGRREAVVPADGPVAAVLAEPPRPDVVIEKAADATWSATPADEDVILEYLPLTSTSAGGEAATLGAVLVARDAAPIIERLDRAQTDVVLTTLSAALVVAVLLFFIFRAAQGRISRQTAALIESARRDPVTDLLNHGTVVEALADALDAARAAKGMVSIGLLDIDNFTLVNEVHGHPAGDELLRRMAGLTAHLDEGWIVGRFGPDEFLVVAPGASASRLEGVLTAFRHDLRDSSVQFGRSEQLPITFSAGISASPEQADSATELLSSAALTLAEAKSAGGDVIRVTDRTVDERADARGFDVLQGLVIAVDNKDRYTKRHSEDVARYASFIARRVGLDEEFQSTVRLAGLLHDVGKIGIPDVILRKPGSLSEDEAQVVKQHVALGDAIVRDLPSIELIRAGIRHHHERWDGHGYLHGLEQEAIPLIARILAVADTFSAMTTTRPYRKALPLTEALKRLGDAAGSQLDETLVTAFIGGIETAADAPLPGHDVPAGQLWIPPPLTAPRPA